MLKYAQYLMFLPNLLTWIMKKMNVPVDVQQVVMHIAVVFTTAFVGQIVGASVGAFDWPTISALLVSAAVAGGSASLHYLLGLVPSPAAIAATKASRAAKK